MAIDAQPVHLGVVVIGIQQVERTAIIGRLERAKDIGREHRAVCRQLAENRLADVGGHAVQPRISVGLAQILVLVVIVVGDFDLTDRFRREVAPCL